MNTNIFRIEFKRIFKPTIYWSIFIVALIFIDMFFYDSMMENGTLKEAVNFMKNPLVGNMLKGFGINPDQLTNILGFYVMRNTMIELLVGSIFSIIFASSVISLEEYEKTFEFLLSKPVTRFEVLSSKLTAYHINLFIMNLLASIFGFLSLEVFKKTDYNLFAYIILCLYTYFLTLLFGSIGLFFSILVKRGRVFTGALIGIVLGAYFIEIISNVTESANFIGYFSPFKFVDKDVLGKGYNLDLWKTLYFLCGSLLLTIFSYRIFQKKDIVV